MTETELLRPMTLNAATAFLREAAVYFRKRSAEGGDEAYWANAQNADNCERVINLLFSMRAESAAGKKGAP